MSKHQKAASTRNKVILCIICGLAAFLIAIITAYFISYWCKNILPTSDSLSNETSDLTLSVLGEDYNLTDIIEPDAQELPVQIESQGDTIVITVTEVIEMVEQVEQTKENTIIVKTPTIDASNLIERKIKLPVECVLQNPELPTGCEITSLTTVLNYYGYSVSKTTMSDEYLEKSFDKVESFWEVFLGNPRSNGFGCYAQPIVNAANKYLKDQVSKYRAVNYSGATFEKLLKEVENGNPVIIWSTMYDEKKKDLHEPYTTYKWEINGKTIQWIAPEHCMVLIGYDIDRNIAIMSDPQRGIVEYNLETVKARYAAIHSQCVILEKVGLPPTINGVLDDECYYTTKYITVKDDDLKSVTVNYQHYNNEFFIPGNEENSYEIIATDEQGNKTVINFQTKPIYSIFEPISDLTIQNVTTDNYKTIHDVKNKLLKLDTNYITTEENKEINDYIKACNSLLEKIEYVQNAYDLIINTIASYDTPSATHINTEQLNAIINDIDELFSGNNLTPSQIQKLSDTKEKCKELLAKTDENKDFPKKEE